MIKNTLADNEDVDKKVKEAFKNTEIGSFDDFMSRHFDTVIVSLCKTSHVEKYGGPLLNNPLNVDFLKSRATKKLVIISKESSLNKLWKREIYSVADSQGHVLNI